LPVGTALRFEFQLKDASPLIMGEGTVVWIREPDALRAGTAPGMGVRFDKLGPSDQATLDKILAHKARESAEPEPFGDVPTRVVSGDLLESLQDGGTDPKRTLMGIGQFKPEPTPLPRPAPFSADLDEFPDEAVEEATKVASLDALARRTADTDPPSSPVAPAESSPAATLIGAGALRTSALTEDTTPPPSAPVVDLSARRSGSPTEPPARAPSAPASRSDAPTTRPLSPLAA